MKPTPGRIVIYKSKIDNGPGNDVISPAIILRTRDTTVKEVIDRWGEPVELTAVDGTKHKTSSRPDALVPELPDDDTVDLVVFGLGKIYWEYCVKLGDRLGEWSWPEIQTTTGKLEVRPISLEEMLEADVEGSGIIWSDEFFQG